MQTQRVVFNLLIHDQFDSWRQRHVHQFWTAVTWSVADGYLRWHGERGGALVSYLDEFDELIGFEALHYDLHVLGSYVPQDRVQMIDTLKARLIDFEVLLRQHSGLRLSLNQVARDTLEQDAFALPDALASDEECFRYNQRNVELIRGLDDFRRAYGFLTVGTLAVRLPHNRDMRNEAA